ALGNFTYLAISVGSAYGVKDGDVVKATMIGNVITAYINDVQVLQVMDDTYAAGNPGMGFFIGNVLGTDGAGRDGDYGFTSYTATSSPGNQTGHTWAHVQSNSNNSSSATNALA